VETLSCAVREHRDSVKKTSTPKKHPVYRTSKLQPEMSAAVYIFFGQTPKLHLKIGLSFFLFPVFFSKTKNLSFL